MVLFLIVLPFFLLELDYVAAVAVVAVAVNAVVVVVVGVLADADASGGIVAAV